MKKASSLLAVSKIFETVKNLESHPERLSEKSDTPEEALLKLIMCCVIHRIQAESPDAITRSIDDLMQQMPAILEMLPRENRMLVSMSLKMMGARMKALPEPEGMKNG